MFGIPARGAGVIYLRYWKWFSLPSAEIGGAGILVVAARLTAAILIPSHPPLILMILLMIVWFIADVCVGVIELFWYS